MPTRVATPLVKNRSMARANGNLESAWVTIQPFDARNQRKLFVTDNNTIASIFNETEFINGTTASSSDLVRIFNPLTGSYTGYFIYTVSGTWRLSLNRNGPDQNDTIIPNKSIIVFQRVGIAGLKTLNLKGTARVGVYQ